MQRAKKNDSFYILIAIAIVVASFLYSWKFIIPQYISNQEKLTSLKQDVKAAKTKLASLETSKRTLSNLGDLVNEMLVAVPGDIDKPNLITELEATAAKYGTIIPSIEINDGSSSTSTSANNNLSASKNEIAVSFAVAGSFENMSGFMNALEKDTRYMNVRSVTLSGGSNSSQMSMLIQLTAYKRADTSLSSSATTGLDSETDLSETGE